jgi:hypothetical protein
MLSLRLILSALVIAAALGALGTLYFWTIRRRQDEAESGVRAMSAMRWREFSHFVLDAMRHRGFDVLTPDDEVDRGQQTEFVLMRNGERALLSCKHGSAYRLTKQSVAEFVAAMKFQGARSGLLVTPGNIEADARKPADDAGIELIDGKALWPEIVPLLPPSLSEDVRREAANRARRQVGLAWVGALVAGIAVALFVGTTGPKQVPNDVTVLAPHAPAAAPPAPAVDAATPGAPVGISAPSTAVVAASPEEEDLQRVEVVRMVSTLPGVSRAAWSTKSTLLVNVDETTTERFDEICTVLMHYASLRTARVHLQPPPDSQQMVRFKQCATY